MNLTTVCEFIQNAYWGKHLRKDELVKSFQFSYCVGLFGNKRQLGFARVVSDRSTCAYVKDFFILADFQRRGYGRQLLQGLMNHPDLADVSNWYLGTKNAHAFYEANGFVNSPDGIYMFFNRDL